MQEGVTFYMPNTCVSIYIYKQQYCSGTVTKIPVIAQCHQDSHSNDVETR